MKKTFRVYNECLTWVSVDVPEDAAPEEIEDMVEERYYSNEVFKCEDIPEITDIETEDGEPLIPVKAKDINIPDVLKDEESLLVYVPEYKEVFRLEDGCGLAGDFLTEEDVREGYDGYINWDSAKFSDSDLDDIFKGNDGGVFLYANAEVDSWQDCVRDVINDALDLPYGTRLNIVIMGSGDTER